MKLSKPVKIVLLLLLGSFLIAVRTFENNWFYDPFIAHFKQADYLKSVPGFETIRLIYNLLLRYILNSFASILILVLIFDTQIIRFLLALYLLFGILLGLIYVFLMLYFLPESFTLFFYIRRFVIQPLLLFVLIPAIFYGRKTNKIHTFTTKK